MIASLLTSFFFALSAIFARRSTLHVGAQRANLARQMVALVLLGLWAHTWGQGLNGATLGILFLSGVVGFGLGDWALFEAYPRIGSALTILLCQCLAAPIAAVTEWVWLGTAMSWMQLASSAAILVGVALAMSPEHASDIPAGHRVAGTVYGVLAAVGQAWGAVLSRYAFLRAHEAGFALDGITAAYQRLWGGTLSIALLLLLRGLARRWRSAGTVEAGADWRGGWPWILGNALAGATVGVSCYQWALKSTPSAIVLPIVATTPLIVMGIAFVFEGIRPTRRALAGSILAVTGVAVLVWQS
jgi:drug/metabolite transporter (DMT)-like permease